MKATLSPAQRAAVHKLLANSKPIIAGKPTTQPRKPSLLNQFINWYSTKI